MENNETPPISAYTDILINDNDRYINSINNLYSDLELDQDTIELNRAIQNSLKESSTDVDLELDQDTIELNRAIQNSLKESNTDVGLELDQDTIELNRAIQNSLKELDYDTVELDHDTVELDHDTVELDIDSKLEFDLPIQNSLKESTDTNEFDQIKKNRYFKLNNFMIQLKRLNIFQKNKHLEFLLKNLDDYINNIIDDFSITSEQYYLIFNELKTVRILNETYDILNKIIYIKENKMNNTFNIDNSKYY